MAEHKVMYDCFICRSKFQMGPHRYDGKYNRTYDISICRICHESNWDGWAPQFEDRIVEHALAAGLTIPPRNGKDLLPRDLQ